MGKVTASKAIAALRAAVKFSHLLDGIDMEDAPRHTTVFVSKRGKIIGTVHGQRPTRREPSDA